MRILPTTILVLCAALIGCTPAVHIEKPTIPVAPKTDSTKQQSGPQTTGDRGVNVGTVKIDGGALVLCVVGVMVLLALLIRSRAGYKRAVGTLVRHNAEAGIAEQTKRAVQLRALADGSEKWLHRVVKQIRRQQVVQTVQRMPRTPHA